MAASFALARYGGQALLRNGVIRRPRPPSRLRAMEAKPSFALACYGGRGRGFAVLLMAERGGFEPPIGD